METPPILPPVANPAPPRRKGRGPRLALVFLIMLVLAAALYLAVHPREAAISVQTEKVTRHTLTETVTANGKIYPVVQVHISPEVSGEIIALNVKEGQFVHRGDLLLKIKPDFYLALLNQAKAGYESSLATEATAAANLEKADADFKRNQELLDHKLLSESDFISFKVARDVAKAQLDSAGDQVNVAKANVDSAQDSLDKCTIVAPLDGTITTLNSQLGERVLGTVQNAGTDIMIISDLSRMEARVDIGEMDIVLVQIGQKATLEVDSFKDKKFAGLVTAVGISSEGLNASSGLGAAASAGQAATQFQVRIRFAETAQFRPGMSVSAVIETRSRTNVLGAPIASVTTRVVRPKGKVGNDSSKTNPVPAEPPAATNGMTPSAKTGKKEKDANKPVDVVFVVEGDRVKTVPVKIGISDEDYYEITDGLKAGEEIVTGGFKAIGRELDDGKKIVREPANDRGKLK